MKANREQELTSQALIIMVITGLGAVGFGLWVLVSALSLGALRAWALATFVIIPLAFIAGWRLGTRDARAHLSGLDKGIGAVMGAAAKTADLRATAAGRVRQVLTIAPTSSTLSLPDPEIIHVRGVNEDEVIDL